MKSQKKAKKLGSLQAEREQAYQQVLAGSAGGGSSEMNHSLGMSRSGLITLSPRKVAEMSPERTEEIKRKESELNGLRD